MSRCAAGGPRAPFARHSTRAFARTSSLRLLPPFGFGVARFAGIAALSRPADRRAAAPQVAYAIGIAKPLSTYVNTYGTGTKTDAEILEIVHKNFDLRPFAIIKELDLKRPIYSKTASFGHFGRNDPDFTWETPKKLVL